MSSSGETGGRMTGRVTDNACRTWLGPKKSYRSATGRQTDTSYSDRLLHFFPFCTARSADEDTLWHVDENCRKPRRVKSFFFCCKTKTDSIVLALACKERPPSPRHREVVKVKHFKRLLGFSHHCRLIPGLQWSLLNQETMVLASDMNPRLPLSSDIGHM